MVLGVQERLDHNMAILNLPTFKEQEVKTPEEKLLESLQQIQVQRPTAEVPRFTRYGNRMAERGGFDVLPQEQLSGMTQQQIDQYEAERRKARGAGISETLMRMGQAFAGKDANAGILRRQQAKQQAEMQKNYQAQYQAAIQSAEQTNPQQANLLRNLGLSGFVGLQQKRAEQMLLGGKRENVELYELVNENNEFIQNITEAEYMDKVANKTLPKGSKLKRLPTSTEAAKTVKADDVSDFIKPLETRYDATIQLVNAIQGAADQIAKEPTAALGVGGILQFADAVIQNIDATTNFLDKANKNEYYQEMLQGTYVAEDTGKDFTEQIKQISGGNAVLESKIRDLAYLFAASRGQEGRGLSDKDYENALRIVSGGVGAEGRIAVLKDVSSRVTQDIMGELQRKKTRYEYMSTATDVEDPKMYNQYINEIDALFQTPISTFVNPLIKQATGLSDEELLELYGQ